MTEVKVPPSPVDGGGFNIDIWKGAVYEGSLFRSGSSCIFDDIKGSIGDIVFADSKSLFDALAVVRRLVVANTPNPIVADVVAAIDAALCYTYPMAAREDSWRAFFADVKKVLEKGGGDIQKVVVVGAQ